MKISDNVKFQLQLFRTVNFGTRSGLEQDKFRVFSYSRFPHEKFGNTDELSSIQRHIIFVQGADTVVLRHGKEAI